MSILPGALLSREVSFLCVLHSDPDIYSVVSFKIVVKVNEDSEIQNLNDDHEQDKVDICDLMYNISK